MGFDYAFDIPDDGVEDGPSRRRCAGLLRQMLLGTLTRDALPPLDNLRGFGEVTNACLTRYFDGDTGMLWNIATALLMTDPALADAVFSPADSDALPPSLPFLRPSELATLPPVSFLDADRLIQANGISMLVGKPGTGKSLWALAKAHEIGQSMPVAYVAAEAQHSLYDRMLALGKAKGQPMPETVYTCTRPVNLRQPEQVQALADQVTDWGARLLVFDTWAGCTAGADENSVRDVQPIFETLEALKTGADCGILLIHHTRKDGGIYRGSSAIQGALDNMYLLSDDEGLLRLKADKTRDSLKPEPKHYRIVQFETRPHPLTGAPVQAPALLPAAQVLDAPDAAPQRVTGNQRTILEALDAFDAGLPARELQDVAALSSSTFFREIKKLQANGYVFKEGSGPQAVYCLSPAGRAAF